jgi:hypothetical protein
MLIQHFAPVALERAIYLRKCILAKLVLQFILIFVVRISMFFVLPVVMDK